MKTMKLFLAVLLLGLFALASTAQPPKTVTCEPVPIYDYYLACFDEIVTGELELCVTYWDNGKTQAKFKGSLTGETTGNIYTVSQVENNMYKPWIEGQAANYTSTLTLSFCLEGMEVFVIHYTYHYTYNANGELVVFVDNSVIECY